MTYVRRYRRGADPLKALSLALRSAAHGIEHSTVRDYAAREAELIPETFAERMPNTVTGKVARHARALLKSLPALQSEDFSTTAETLRCFALVLDKHAAKPGRATAS